MRLNVPRNPTATSTRQRRVNAEARRITGRPYVSHSQLSTMRSCPKKFQFQYVLAARPDHQPSSLLFGGAIHSALELHFRLVMEGLAATPEALLSAYHDAWREQRRAVGPSVPVRFNAGEDQGKLDALADRLIWVFLSSAAATPSGTILGVEEELTIVLDDDVPDVLTRVDLVVQEEGALVVTDYKTSRSRWSESKAIESAEQLQLYAAAVRRISEDLNLPVRLRFAVLTKAKSPRVSSPGGVFFPETSARVRHVR